jgi:hypothetical protein
MLAVLFISFYFKYKTGKIKVAIFIAYLTGTFFLTYMNVIVGEKIYAFLVFFTLIPLPFFLFNKEEIKNIILLEFILCSIIVGMFIYNAHFLPFFVFPQNLVQATNYMLVCLTIAILITSSFYLWNETMIAEEKVLSEKNKTQKALENLHELKIHQDGDYFLTSLLVSPLNGNFVKSEWIETKIFLKSKKQFQFRNKTKEIGGDLNLLDEIFLGGKKYFIFLNADAMGKSLQGAGGALVLGAVLKSLIIRTKISSNDEEKYPEIWLKHTFDELEQVFQTFNGSMLVSVVMGLIEEHTGFVYYINAEHPFIVLYRDKKAEFIETELQNRKLGTAGFNDNVVIRTFQMHPNDTLIAGSDGRDDIIIDKGNGEIGVNFDDSKFLSFVENGKGDLEEIYKLIEKSGEIIDDLSLLSIHYKGKIHAKVKFDSLDSKKKYQWAIELKEAKNYRQAITILKEIYEVEPNNLLVLKQITSLSVRLGSYSDVLDFSKKILDIAPSETKFLFYTSFALYKLGDLQNSIFYSERVFLRDHSNVKNLIHLVKLYRIKKNFKSAHFYNEIGLQIDPRNRYLLKLHALHQN